MTGPEHYAAAEAALRRAESIDLLSDDPRAHAMNVAEAQVHATLALVAATVRQAPVIVADRERGPAGLPEAEWHAWAEAIGEPA